MRVTSNTALLLLRGQRRSQARDQRAGATQDQPQPSEAHSHHEQTETAALIRRELAELPEPTRAAIMLHVMEGLGYEAVAATLGVPVGSAKTRVHRGLEVLRHRLGRAGLALSLTMLIGGLQELAAAPVPPPGPTSSAEWQAVLSSPRTSMLPGIGAAHSSWSGWLVASATVIGAVLGALWFMPDWSTRTPAIPQESPEQTMPAVVPPVAPLHASTGHALISVTPKPVLKPVAVTKARYRIDLTNGTVADLVDELSNYVGPISDSPWLETNAQRLVTCSIHCNDLDELASQIETVLDCTVVFLRSGNALMPPDHGPDIQKAPVPSPPMATPTTNF